MLLSSAVLLLAPSLPQIVGGDWPTLHRFDGEASWDFLGQVVSGAGDVNGDGFDDVLVGAPNADPGGLDFAGSVYVYSGADGALLHQWNGASSNRWLGTSISCAGDVDGDGFDDLIIGDPYAPVGQATVYSGVDGAVIHSLTGPVASGGYGAAVSDAGDVDADGFPDLIVSDTSADPGGVTDAGSVYVHSGLDGSLLHQWDGAGSGDAFGTFVASAGDVDADGYDDLAVGARWLDSAAGVDAGSAFVYSGADGSLIHQWDGASAGDGFGSTVTGAGDVDGDGFDDLLVGAWRADAPGVADTGAAFVYSGVDGTLLYEWTGAEWEDHFGFSASSAGDMSGDGVPDILIGADGTDSVFLYSGADGSLLHEWWELYIFEGFGISVSDAGDVNADGSPDVVVGAMFADGGGLDGSGSAYVFGFVDPILTASTQTISVSADVTVDLGIDAPATAAGFGYITLVSATGTGPTSYGVDIPLTVDDYLLDSVSGSYPFPIHANLQGSLDSSGDASASFTIPAGTVNGGLVGRSFWLATVVLEGHVPELSSVAVEFTFAP